MSHRSYYIKAELKRHVQNVFRFFGVSIHKAQSRLSPFNKQRIDVVLDVGANHGYFGYELRKRHAYKKRIISFEPLPECQHTLRKLARDDPLWTICDPVALGSENIKKQFHRTADSTSSSFFESTAAHTEVAQSSNIIGSFFVEQVTLDSLIDKIVSKDDVLALKIDTQGYEWPVLMGASKTLERVKLLVIELNLIQCYHGEKNFFEMIDFIHSQSFTPFDFSLGVCNQDSGQRLTVDGYFVKK